MESLTCCVHFSSLSASPLIENLPARKVRLLCVSVTEHNTLPTDCRLMHVFATLRSAVGVGGTPCLQSGNNVLYVTDFRIVVDATSDS